MINSAADISAPRSAFGPYSPYPAGTAYDANPALDVSGAAIDLMRRQDQQIRIRQPLYWQFPEAEDENLAPVTQQQAYAALRTIVEALQPDDSSAIISPFSDLSIEALPCAIMLFITDKLAVQNALLLQGLENAHEGRMKIMRERVETYREQMQKALEAQKKAHNALLFNLGLDWLIGAVEIIWGAVKIAGGVLSGNGVQIISGFSLVIAGVIGLSKAATETAAFIAWQRGDVETAAELENSASTLNKMEMGFAFTGLAIDGMGKIYEGVQSYRTVGKAVAGAISEEAANGARQAAAEATRAGAQGLEQVKQFVAQAAEAITEALTNQGWQRVTEEQIGNIVQKAVFEAEGDLISKITRRIALSIMPPRVLETLSTSHLLEGGAYFLQASRSVVNGVLGGEIAQSVCEAEQLEAQLSFQKTEQDLYKRRVGTLLRQSQENLKRAVEIQADMQKVNNQFGNVANAIARAF